MCIATTRGPELTDFRSFLRGLGQTDDELKRLHEKLDQQWTACLGMGGHGDSGGIGGGGTGGPRDGPLVSFSDTVELLIQAKVRKAKLENCLTVFLLTLEQNQHHGRRDALILRDRYLRRLSWKDILDDLKRAGFQVTTLRTVYLWHSDALRRGDQLWEERYSDERLHKGAGV